MDQLQRPAEHDSQHGKPAPLPASTASSVHPRTSPAEVIAEFSRRLSAGDLPGMLALYQDDAAFAVQPGDIVSGKLAIQAALGQLLSLRPTISGEVVQVIETTGTALVAFRWRLRGVEATGQIVELAGISADVLRRQPNGNWLVAIDDPWGGCHPSYAPA